MGNHQSHQSGGAAHHGKSLHTPSSCTFIGAATATANGGAHDDDAGLLGLRLGLGTRAGCLAGERIAPGSWPPEPPSHRRRRRADRRWECEARSSPGGDGEVGCSNLWLRWG